MLSVSRRLKCPKWTAAPSFSGWQRSYAIQSYLREYFVLVSDRHDADRKGIQKLDLVPPFCMFAGECLSPQAAGQQPEIVGNAFAFLAQSVEGAKETMVSSIYNQQKIWDISSMKIIPLLTVHSSNLGRMSTRGGAPANPHRKPERLVILPDRPNVLARRVAMRPYHSPNFVRLHNEGYVSWAGPVFEEHVDADISQRPFKGSVMVVNEKDWDGFVKTVQSDVYVKEKIWDLKRASFIPFRTLMRRVE